MIDDPACLRPHAKTHKSPEATQLLLAAGISKFKCATIAEAEMLGSCKSPDVLLAYPLNAVRLNRFIKLIRKFPDTHYSVIIDNTEAADHLSATAVASVFKLLIRI